MKARAILIVALSFVVLAGCGSGKTDRAVTRAGSLNFVNGAFVFHGATPDDWYKNVLGVKVGTRAAVVLSRFGRPYVRTHPPRYLPDGRLVRGRLTYWWYRTRPYQASWGLGFGIDASGRVRGVVESTHG